MEIPIKNIYYMLCYAWQYLDSIKKRDVGSALGENVTDLLARILAECVNETVQRGIWRDYSESTSEIAGLQGKLLISHTIQKSLLQSGRTACTTDEFTINNRLNQLVASTVRAMRKVKGINDQLKETLMAVENPFREVASRPVTARDFRAVRTGRLNWHYAHTLRVCELIWEQLTPADGGNGFIFEEFHRNEVKMRRVFEAFVRNFFILERLGSTQVKSEELRWHQPDQKAGERSLLPILRTDTSLIARDHYTVIETKFVPQVLKSRHEGFEKIRSGHLYQLMAYLENIRRTKGITPRGVLLYPRTDRDIAETYRIWDFEVRVCTLDLRKDWQGIREDLLSLIPGARAA